MPRLPLTIAAAAALGLLVAAVAPAARAFETLAKNAVVMDHRTGLVMFEKDADRRIPPASMSKLMTAYMIFDRLKRGRLKLDDEITVSERSWKMGGSQMFLKVGDRVRVEDLIRGIIIQSGNDACVAMAEALSGSEEAFAREMTEKAQELGLTNSTFANSTGLDAPDHLMSVRDLAKLARAIITEFPDYYKYYGEKEYVYRDIKQQNRNPLLQAGVPGVDGMKTGYTEDAGYGLVATAKRDDRRVITVLAGLEKLGQRKGEAERLLEFGFREFQEYRLFQAGETVAEADVWLGAGPKVALVPADTVGVTLPREKRKGLVVKLRYDSPVPAPVAAGQRLGQLEISAPGMETYAVPLVAAQEVPKAGVLGRLTGALTHLVLGAAG
jgi:D-alanyl-D-alanine carboxypeptidase (penicillin-binding protein 5/6)